MKMRIELFPIMSDIGTVFGWYAIHIVFCRRLRWCIGRIRHAKP